MAENELKKETLRKIGRAVPRKALTPLAISFIAILSLTAGFAALAEGVTEHETTAFDEAILLAINQLSSTFLDVMISVLTEFGGLIGVLTLSIGAAALFGARRKWRRAALLLVAVGGGSALNLILKGIFARSRPNLWDHLVTELTYSFPSGHAMASMALGAGLVAALWDTRYRRVALIGSSVYVLVIAFTRLYLGVHYPTDILAGWTVSLAWVVAVRLLFDYRFRKKLPGIDDT